MKHDESQQLRNRNGKIGERPGSIHKRRRQQENKDNNRNSQTGEKEAQFLPLEYFTPADRDDLQVFNYMYKGDKVTIQYTLKNVQYTDTENRKVYSLVLQIENIRLDETKSSTHANTAANTGGKKQTRQRSNSRSK